MKRNEKVIKSLWKTGSPKLSRELQLKLRESKNLQLEHPLSLPSSSSLFTRNNATLARSFISHSTSSSEGEGWDLREVEDALCC